MKQIYTIASVALLLTVSVVGARKSPASDAIPATDSACRLVVDFLPNPNPANSAEPGRLYFVDARAGVSIHGIVRSRSAEESVASRRFREIRGSYTGSPGTGANGGRLYAAFYDNGPHGASREDCFELRLFGGEYDGYYYAGSLDGPGAPTTD